MELFLFIVALIALPALAVRFGVDSRHEFSATGHDLAWTETRSSSGLVGILAPSRRVRITAGIPARTPAGVVPEPPVDDDESLSGVPARTA